MDVIIMLLGRLGSGLYAKLENEETKPPKPRNDRNQRCAESLNGKTEGESNEGRQAGIIRHELRGY